MKKYILILIFLLTAAPFGVSARESVLVNNAIISKLYIEERPQRSMSDSEELAQGSVPESKERPKVGLVLSGGGAKGMAHIRVIQVLEEAGIPIDYVAGTSIGAIMGGLYSIGYTTHELDSLVRAQDWMGLLSDRVARYDKRYHERENADTYIVSVPMSFDRKFTLPSGATAGQNVLNLLNEMTIGYHDKDIDFDRMPIPFACVAYDMVEGKEYVFRKGNLPVAIRASMSIPGAFAPVLLDSMVLVDGGIYNNFPVDVVKEMGADVVIGVDLSASIPEYDDVNSIVGMLEQMTNIMGRDKYDENLRNVDLYIHPDIDPYNSASFSPEAIDTLLARGEMAARSKWHEIMALKKRLFGADFVPQRPSRVGDEEDNLEAIGKIIFTGLSLNEEALIRRSLGLEENSRVSKHDINSAIERLRGSGAFSYVTYTLDSKPPYNLNISVNEKQEAVVQLGFRFDSEEMASILLGSAFSLRGLMGPRMDATLRLNSNPYFELDFNSSRWLLGRVGLSYMLRDNKFTFYERGENPTRISFIQHRVAISMHNANPDTFSVNAGVQYERFNYQSFLWSTDPKDMAIIQPKGYINYFARSYFDDMDDYYYPTHGYSINTVLTLHTDNGYRFENELPFASAEYNLRTAISYNNRLSFIPSIYGRTLIGHLADKENYFGYMNALGGELPGRYVQQQMVFPGVRNIEYLENSVMVTSLEVRMRLFRRHYVSLKGAFGVQNDDFFGMFYDNFKESYIWGAAIKYSYNTPIGPISIQLDTSNLNRSLRAYISVGKNF